MTFTQPLAAAALLCLAGCTAPIHLYPIQPPGSDPSVAPVIKARISGPNSGTIDFQLASGERCEGPWSMVDQESTDFGLAPVWDSIYGSGYFKANVLGSRRYGRAIVSGDQGTRFQIEFNFGPNQHSALLGIARDSHGLIYKVVY